MSRLHKRVRKKLHAENPNCYWCGKATVLRKRSGRGKQKPDDATLEHLISKLSPDTAQRQNPDNMRLACYACNHQRGEDEVNAFPKEMWRLRSMKGRALDAWFDSWERDISRWDRF